jgi:thermitase
MTPHDLRRSLYAAFSSVVVFLVACRPAPSPSTPIISVYDPGLANDSGTLHFFFPAFDGLPWLDTNGQSRPGPAKEPKAPSNTAWGFTLGDYKFQNGRAVTEEYFKKPIGSGPFKVEQANFPGGLTTAMPNSDEIPSGRIMVAFRDGSPATAMRQASAVRGAKLTKVDPKSGIAIYEVAAGSEKEKADEFKSNAAVRFAEPDSRTLAQLVPNDASYNQQWAPAKINAPMAWDVTTGSATITLAILDTGIDLTSQEFSGRVVPGYNFIGEDTNVQDDHGHGTHVSGIAAASGNNGVGIAGLAWNISILPVKVLSGSGEGYVSDLIAGIDFARERGAKIINISLGTSTFSELLQEAVNRAIDAGVLVVAAAGNSGTESNAPSYPAAFPGVIAVAATDSTDVRAPYSTSGSYVSIAAPGTGIYSTYPGGYATMSGTSAAAAHVSGMASLIWSQNPALKASDVFETIRSTAVDLGAPGKDDLYGSGRIDFSEWAKRFAPAPGQSAPSTVGGGSSNGPHVYVPAALNSTR